MDIRKIIQLESELATCRAVIKACKEDELALNDSLAGLSRNAEYRSAQKEAQRVKTELELARLGDEGGSFRVEAEYALPSALTEWRDVVDPRLRDYEVSDDGFLRNKNSQRVYKRKVSGRHLWSSVIGVNGSAVRVRLDLLVAESFGISDGRRQVRALDGNPFNCRKENLIV